MENIIINIYWHDLSAEGKNTIVNAGFNPTAEEREETKPIGVIVTGANDAQNISVL